MKTPETPEYYQQLGNELAENGFKSIYSSLSARSDRIHVIIDTTELELDSIVKPYARNNELTVSIGPKACSDLKVSEGRVSFTVTFAGIARHMSVDINRIVAMTDGYGGLYIIQQFEILIPGDVAAVVNKPKTKSKPRFTVIDGGVN